KADDLDAGRRLRRDHRLEQPVGRRTGRTPFRREQLDEDDDRDGEHYQFTLTPMRITRGATTALIWFAVAAFCVRCSAWTVLPLKRLKMSRLGTKRAVPNRTGRSTRTSTFWEFGRRVPPTGSPRSAPTA